MHTQLTTEAKSVYHQPSCLNLHGGSPQHSHELLHQSLLLLDFSPINHMAQSGHPTPRQLWRHPNPQSTAMWRFMQASNRKRNLNMQSFRDLYEWSVGDDRTDFWADMWDASGLIYSGSYTEVVDTTAPMDSIPHWFQGTYLNFAENVLFSADAKDPSKTTTVGKEDDKIALTQIREGNTEVQHMTFGEVRKSVALVANALRAKGVKKGDRVAVVAGTSFDTFVDFMAVLSIGGLFSSSSTDMGTKGILERLLQIRPKFVFMDDWAVYNGKTIDLRPKMKEIVEGMRGVKEFESVVAQSRFPGKPADLSGIDNAISLETLLKAANGKDELVFERVAFRDPFLIVYSSGTTGIPKCIVHSTGGVLVSVMKEGLLHKEMGPDNVVLQYTTVSLPFCPQKSRYWKDLC
jgi:acetoacetyl-CoA synthetase